MAYTPTEWTSGDVITAEKLNHIEGGVENSNAEPLIVGWEDVNSGQQYGIRLTKTWNEINEAFTHGIPVLLHRTQSEIASYSDPGYTIVGSTATVYDHSTGNIALYGLYFQDPTSSYSFYSDTVDDYPFMNFAD